MDTFDTFDIPIK